MDALVRHGGRKVDLKTLVGSGDRIGLFVLPFLVVGLALNWIFPSFFSAGDPATVLRFESIAVLIAGVVAWGWSVVLILTRVPRGELITTGPYAVVKHPLYTAVALLVIPAAGLLLNTWLGVVLGLVMYAAVRIFAPAEEAQLSRTFGARWDAYRDAVWIPWL